jgi:2-methylcitrate dehydratase PrpD
MGTSLEIELRNKLFTLTLIGGQAKMNETRELAKFLTGLRFNDLKDEVVEKAKGLVLDLAGCQLGFATLPWSKAVYQYTSNKKSTVHESTVVYYGLKTTAEDAAFANAVFGHGFEMDDTEMLTASHPGVAVIPSAMAMGEAGDISGKDFITAVVAGYDAMLRPGIATREMMMRGFHSTGVGGPLGSAAAASKILGFDANTMVNALGIAASESSGITEYAISGGSVKRLHAGFAAQSGVKAALLAKFGITGPTAALEGKKGFCHVFSEKCSEGEITRDLGKEYRIMLTGNKPYCCCAGQHTVIDAGDKIKQDHKIKPEEIAEIIIEQRPREAINLGNIIIPEDIISAQFSARFGLALRLIKGSNGFQDYNEKNIKDPQILNLVQKMKYFADEKGEKLKIDDGGPALVTIKLNDGTTYQQKVDYAKGSIQNPLTPKELENKFRDLVAKAVSEKRIENIIKTVRGLDELQNIKTLTSLLVSDCKA